MIFTVRQIKNAIYELCKDCCYHNCDNTCDLGQLDTIAFDNNNVVCLDRNTSLTPTSIPWYYTSKPK